MASSPTYAVVGFVLPAFLLGANLWFGYGGIVATIGLFVWIGLAILFTPGDEGA